MEEEREGPGQGESQLLTSWRAGLPPGPGAALLSLLAPPSTPSSFPPELAVPQWHDVPLHLLSVPPAAPPPQPQQASPLLSPAQLKPPSIPPCLPSFLLALLSPDHASPPAPPPLTTLSTSNYCQGPDQDWLPGSHQQHHTDLKLLNLGIEVETPLVENIENFNQSVTLI